MGQNNPLNTALTFDKDLILFDGVCNLCNGAVKFILSKDAEEKFLFASLQSGVADQVLASKQRTPSRLSSIVVLSRNGKLMVKSDAALYIAAHLSGGWSMLRILRIFPRFIRDGVYDFIAKYRYSIFGKKDKCMIPSPELKQRFLDANVQ